MWRGRRTWNNRGTRPVLTPTRGDSYGGITSRQGCENLPANLQAGCYWRFNWARGDINGWKIQYEQVTCPFRLTSISGCEAKFP